MPKKSITAPVLYKYRRADEYTIDLLGGKVYFAPPQELNDPTDLNLGHGGERQFKQRVERLQSQINDNELVIRFKDDELADYEKKLRRKARDRFRSTYAHLQTFADEMPSGKWLEEMAYEKQLKIERQVEIYRQKLEEDTSQRQAKIEVLRSELRRLEQAWKATKRGKHFALATRGMGVLCLTTEHENYRMWALYADGFRGVCVGFNRKRLIAALSALGLDIVAPLRVIYRKITINDLLKPTFVKRQENLYRYKPRAWSSEKEVRFVRRDGFGVVTVPASCIQKIIVGNRVSAEYRERIAEAITRRVNNAKTEDGPLWVGRASGDAEGQVHIDHDFPLDSLVSSWRNKLFEERMKADDSEDGVYLNKGTRLPPFFDEDDDLPF